MQRRNLIILGAAVLFGLIAVFLANSYFSGFEKQEERAAKQEQLARIVVATQELKFGTPLTTDNIRLVNWPQTSVPPGAFRAIPDALRDGRVALRPIAIGEPILTERVSGADGRASISYNLPEDMRAVSIPVSAVAGVSGFVTPGDVVDVLLTRQIPGDGAGDGDKMTDVLMENVQVLAIDQMANEKATNPKVGKTAVLMVDLYGAQKLALARETGSLSLALRNIKNQAAGYLRTVSSRDLSRTGLFMRARQAPSAPAPVMPPASTQIAARRAPGVVMPGLPIGPSMIIVRGTQVTSYEVKSNGGW
jgi:pilus assembly protein CpaB